MLWKYFFSSHFGLFHSKIDPWNTCLVSGTNKWLMRSNWVGTVHVSIVMFVSWAKTYCRTAVWSGTCNSRKSIWLKSWCVLKDELLWTHQNLKGRILHWLFWKNRWYWINFLIKQITSLKVRLLILRSICWRFWLFFFGSKCHHESLFMFQSLGCFSNLCWEVKRGLSGLVLLTVDILAHCSFCSYLTD
jgi:hypothetical protein